MVQIWAKSDIWPNMTILGQNCRYFAKNDNFGPKIHFMRGMDYNFWYLHIREPMRHLFHVENIDPCGSNWLLRTKMWIFGAKSNFFVLDSRFLSTGHITSMPGAKTFPFGPPQKKFRLQAMGHLWGLTPVFGPFGLVSDHKCKYP